MICFCRSRGLADGLRRIPTASQGQPEKKTAFMSRAQVHPLLWLELCPKIMLLALFIKYLLVDMTEVERSFIFKPPVLSWFEIASLCVCVYDPYYFPRWTTSDLKPFIMDRLCGVVVWNIFYCFPYFGKISNLTTIFQSGWNHQLVLHSHPHWLHKSLWVTGWWSKVSPSSDNSRPYELLAGSNTCFKLALEFNWTFLSLELIIWHMASSPLLR